MSFESFWLVLHLLTLQQPATQQKPDTAQQPADRAVEAGARDALHQYSTALQSLDADGVKKIQPAVDVESLKKAFKEMRALEVSIDNIRVLSTQGPIVRVSCRVTQTLTPKAGAKQTTTVTRVMRLRKQEAVWLIDGFER